MAERRQSASGDAPWVMGGDHRGSALEASIAGEVTGRQPFGVFIRVDGAPEAMALAEITAMPEGMDQPGFGARIIGEVIEHAGRAQQRIQQGAAE
ncbi:hypothetical protein [Streptomyces mirabilis]|uniref:hypothetical protein n=1 Tax=Streptomyces mirabilis TaxID=68239 RepID=UPI0033B0B229